MSVSLILQNESRKTMGGYLFVMFLFSGLISTLVFKPSFDDLSAVASFISFLLTISSFLSLAFLTVRPEKWVSRWIIGSEKVPPFFTASKDLSIQTVFQSSYLAKDKDEFWGNFLIGVGFFIAMFIPLNIIYQTELILLIDILKFLLFLLVSSYIFYDLFSSKKKQLREHIEIVWRFFSIISHDQWKNHFQAEIGSLEESIKLRLWFKARYQIKDLDAQFKLNANEIAQYLHHMALALRFLLGDHSLLDRYNDFKSRYVSLRKKYDKALILGLDFTHPEFGPMISLHSTEFWKIDGKYQYYVNEIRKRLDNIKNQFQSTQLPVPDWNLIHDFFTCQLDPRIFHIESLVIKNTDFSRVSQIIQDSESEELINLFSQYDSAYKLYRALSQQEYLFFRNTLEILYQTSDFVTIREKIEHEARDISLWYTEQDFIDKWMIYTF
ncbi:MAG: hypothetical protein EAX86_09565 [Candidatus Heimdallarchaeota archaeon]|nr:hypothetical protein [Candidatus Heimdallarchaeota archaeon]